MYVGMYLCIYVCAYVCMHVCMYRHVHRKIDRQIERKVLTGLFQLFIGTISSFAVLLMLTNRRKVSIQSRLKEQIAVLLCFLQSLQHVPQS